MRHIRRRRRVRRVHQAEAGGIGSRIIGAVMLAGALAGLWWSESRLAEQARLLEAGRSAAVSVSADRVERGNDGRLIHITGRAVTDAVLQDGEFGVSENALKLQRIVEMYQWEERKTERRRQDASGHTVVEDRYSYNRVWSNRVINSDRFYERRHRNPSSMPFQSRTYAAPDIRIGAFRLDDVFLPDLDMYAEYPLSSSHLQNVAEELQGRFTLSGDVFYAGNPSMPNIGDVRIKFRIIRPLIVSVAGRQNGMVIGAYETERGDLRLLRDGALTAEELFDAAEQDSRRWTWWIRGGTGLLILLGGYLLFQRSNRKEPQEESPAASENDGEPPAAA